MEPPINRRRYGVAAFVLLAVTVFVGCQLVALPLRADGREPRSVPMCTPRRELRAARPATDLAAVVRCDPRSTER